MPQILRGTYIPCFKVRAELFILASIRCAESMNFKGIEYNDTKFRLIDVPGDGNCLYHSLVCSGVIERCSSSLRSEAHERVLEYWRNGCSFVKILYALYLKGIPLLQYVQE